MCKELFQVEHKDKLEFGELLNKNNICKHLLNNIVVEFGQFKLTKIVVKQLVQVQMEQLLFGIWKTKIDYYAYKNHLHLNKL